VFHILLIFFLNFIDQILIVFLLILLQTGTTIFGKGMALAQLLKE